MTISKYEICLEEIKGIRIGQAENAAAGTGCTVFIADQGMAAGLDVRGGGDPWDRAGRWECFRPERGRRSDAVS